MSRSDGWLIEPVTGDRYVRDEVGYYKMGPLDSYLHVADFNPPATWREFKKDDGRWDKVFRDRFGDEYAMQAIHYPDNPVPISAALLHMAKSYARQLGSKRLIGKEGVIFWANWKYIPPCWVVIDKKDTYKLFTEEELGVMHERRY